LSNSIVEKIVGTRSANERTLHPSCGSCIVFLSSKVTFRDDVTHHGSTSMIRRFVWLACNVFPSFFSHYSSIFVMTLQNFKFIFLYLIYIFLYLIHIFLIIIFLYEKFIKLKLCFNFIFI
jgi:hypothetical protein